MYVFLFQASASGNRNALILMAGIRLNVHFYHLQNAATDWMFAISDTGDPPKIHSRSR